ncbi:hypothetical protein M409DRAFT_26486 [Zasmidium cellare ATCC 36951]|uniref:Tat pathway signal sequence n=1 Tax=Zasmidium cellare ATCC 36951 TaxID=1080233 RepID=A0A6A6C9Y4_ZASCE|nr:uncharacterized protein M409DRAFT_26486 [Zasmidium cellare ATCC 36951]KAF2163040.1 hypothetical protein M409DRAFT_26486 [Zasmidium cellare ATCC 36951]
MARPAFDDEESDAESTETLIKHSEDCVPHLRRRRRQTRRTWRTVAVHAAAIVFYGVIATLFTIHVNSRNRRSLIYSPANPVVEYENRVYSPHLKGDSEYFGRPSAEIDSNWEDLMLASTIHLTEADRQHHSSDLPTVQLPDGTYAGQLMVYHELHCLKRLHQYINADHYFPNLTDYDRRMNKMHTEHCLGTLRQGVMCHGDVSVMPMVWGKHSRIPLGDFSSPHQCVNFGKLHAWAVQRAVTDGTEPGVLVHPVLGPSFPDGKGTKIGFGDEDIDAEGNIITLNSPDRHEDTF